MFIQIQFRLEPDEYARGIVSAFRRSFRYKQAMGLLCALVGIPGFFIPGSWYIDAILTAAAVNYLPWPYWRRLALKRQYAKAKSQSNTVTLTEDGLSWLDINERGEGGMSVKWAHFTGLRETPEFFMFFTNKNYVHVAPKRAFDPQQAELFSRFVKYGFEEIRAAQLAVAPTAPASAPTAARPSR